MTKFTSEMLQDLETRLKSEVLYVTFTKVNGDTRVMRCTRDFTLVPTEMLPKQDAMPTPRVDSMIRVFDMDKQDWRGFRKDSVISFKINSPESFGVNA